MSIERVEGWHIADRVQMRDGVTAETEYVTYSDHLAEVERVRGSLERIVKFYEGDDHHEDCECSKCYAELAATNRMRAACIAAVWALPHDLTCFRKTVIECTCTRGASLAALRKVQP